MPAAAVPDGIRAFLPAVGLAAFLLSPVCSLAQADTVNIAMCQIEIVDGDKEGNLARIDTALADATRLGAQIVCFPECVFYGWANPDAHTLAQPIPGADSDRICALAVKYGVYVCVGMVEKEGVDLYDSEILVDPQGRIICKHRKVHNLEWLNLIDPPYTNGDGVPQYADTEYGRIGLLICADTGLWWLVDAMAACEPDILLVPFGWAALPENWPENGQSMIDQATYCATTCGAMLIGTNSLGTITNGPWTGWIYGGQSAAISASGDLVATGADRVRDIVIVAVPYTPMAATRPSLGQAGGRMRGTAKRVHLVLDGRTDGIGDAAVLYDLRGRIMSSCQIDSLRELAAGSVLCVVEGREGR
jgi:N-carbamoylputrescine amidase